MAIPIIDARQCDYLVDDSDIVIAVVEYCSEEKLCTLLDKDDRRWVWHLHRIDTSRNTVPVPVALRDLLFDWHRIHSGTLTLVRGSKTTG